MTPRIGAIDQGTTSTRILVAEGDRLTIAHAATHATRYPHPGWVEQDADEIVRNIEACLAAAGPLDRLGLANQGESCLAWDAVSKRPLSPVIVWQDNRTAADLAALPPEAAARVAAIAHLPLDPYFSASKLGWLLRELPDLQSAHRAGRLRLGTTDAYWLDRLAGCFATDRATASRTSLLDFATGAWSEELCALFGVPVECLPPIRPNVGEFGGIGGVPVTAAIVDQQAALYGHGARVPGDAKITFGTGAFALALTGGPVDLAAEAGLLPTVAWDFGNGPAYALDGGVYDVGAAVDWALRAGLAHSLDDFQRFDRPAAIDRGLVFVPAFSGLAAPLWDRSAAPLILGLGADMDRRDLCQALLEGIALSTAEVMTVMAGLAPPRGALRIDGGVSRSPYFAQLLADSLGREVAVAAFADCTALGVALLADNDGTLAPPQGHRLMTPQLSEADRSGRLARFRDARERARGWRPPQS